MLVSGIAYDRLDPKARAAVEKLCGQVEYPGETYTPVTISCWMDDIRTDDPKIPFTGKFKKWHFIVWGLKPEDAIPPLEPGDDDNEKKGNIIQGLKRAEAVLRGGTDPFIPTQGHALAIICHLVGDAHQPLHCASNFFLNKAGKISNDGGGNRVQIDNAPELPAAMNNKTKYNLHSFWDEAYRGEFDAATKQIVLNHELRDYTKKDLSALQKLRAELASLTPDPAISLAPIFEAWARESNALARDFVYPRLPRFKYNMYADIDAAYTVEAKEIARKQIVLAGYRLATLLNGILGEGAKVEK